MRGKWLVISFIKNHSLYKKIVLLIIIVAAMYATWQLQQLLQIKVNPRKSLQRFLLFFVINFIAVFLIIVLTGFIIIHFKEFFFTP